MKWLTSIVFMSDLVCLAELLITFVRDAVAVVFVTVLFDWSIKDLPAALPELFCLACGGTFVREARGTYGGCLCLIYLQFDMYIWLGVNLGLTVLAPAPMPPTDFHRALSLSILYEPEFFKRNLMLRLAGFSSTG